METHAANNVARESLSRPGVVTTLHPSMVGEPVPEWPVPTPDASSGLAVSWFVLNVSKKVKLIHKELWPYIYDVLIIASSCGN